MTKKCKDCSLVKTVNKFYSSGQYYFSYCKECHKKRTNRKNTNRKSDYFRNLETVEQMAANRYSLILQRCGKQKHYFDIECRISKKEFIQIYANKTLKELFTAWKDSGEKPALRPSIDRIDSSRHYEKGNLKWLTLSENCRNAAKQKRNKNGYISVLSKPVRMYDLEGIFIKEFSSAYRAAVHLGNRKGAANIGKVCKKQNKSAMGHLWEYVDKS